MSCIEPNEEIQTEFGGQMLDGKEENYTSLPAAIDFPNSHPLNYTITRMQST